MFSCRKINFGRFLILAVRHPRPHGRPQFTFGHSLKKTLDRAGISSEFKDWSKLAEDRAEWRKLIHGTAKYPPPAPTRSSRTRTGDAGDVAPALDPVAQAAAWNNGGAHAVAAGVAAGLNAGAVQFVPAADPYLHTVNQHPN